MWERIEQNGHDLLKFWKQDHNFLVHCLTFYNWNAPCRLWRAVNSHHQIFLRKHINYILGKLSFAYYKWGSRWIRETGKKEFYSWFPEIVSFNKTFSSHSFSFLYQIIKTVIISSWEVTAAWFHSSSNVDTLKSHALSLFNTSTWAPPMGKEKEGVV